jgi:hypothetical protein
MCGSRYHKENNTEEFVKLVRIRHEVAVDENSDEK